MGVGVALKIFLLKRQQSIGVADLAVCDAATIGYINAKGGYYCPDLEWIGNRDSLDIRRRSLSNSVGLDLRQKR